jgi:hypothetical protein
MKSLSVKLGIVLIGLAVFANAEAWGEDWIRYGKNDTGTYYYDKQDVTRLSKDIVRVSNKIVFTEKGVATAVERLGRSNKQFGCDISLREINCADKTQRWISSKVYSMDGELLQTPPYNTGWEPIIQGTLSDLLLQKVCK